MPYTSKKSRLTLCVVLMLLAFTSASGVNAQRGRGDDPKPIALGDTVEASLASEGDFAVYSLEVEEDTWVEISLESDDFDPTLTLLTDDDDQLAYDDDSGEGTNSLLFTQLAANTTYHLQVRSLGDLSSGDFVLRLGAIEIIAAKLDAPLMVEFDRQSSVYLQFTGEEGAFINILVRDQERNGDDLTLTLQSEDGDQLIYDDEGGEARLPGLRRYVLPYDGVYILKLGTYSAEEIRATYELEIQRTEALILSDEPQAIELGRDFASETMLFEASDNVTYRLTLDPDDDFVSMSVDIRQDDSSVASFNVAGMSRITFDFEVPDDGMIVVSFSGYYGNDESADFMVSLSEVE
jgi:hypothetical protein